LEIGSNNSPDELGFVVEVPVNLNKKNFPVACGGTSIAYSSEDGLLLKVIFTKSCISPVDSKFNSSSTTMFGERTSLCEIALLLCAV
jgi:hypothetical protein